MKPQQFFLLLLILLSIGSCNSENQDISSTQSVEPSERQFFLLKIYSFTDDDQVARTDAFLEEAYLPGLKRLGIGPVGVFNRRISNTDTTLETFVLIPFDQPDEWIRIEDQLYADSEFLTAGNEYITAAHDNAPYQRIESIYLRAFIDMPALRPAELDGPRTDRVYELRSYESATEALYQKKVDMFNAGGEIELFESLDFNAVFYGEVLSGPSMPNLMYMTTFADQESRDTHWKSFVDSEAWKTMSALPKYQNTVSHADIYFLVPTAYSDY